MANYEAWIQRILSDEQALSAEQRATLRKYDAHLKRQGSMPGSRYNAVALARDLGKHFQGKPYEACSPDAYLGFVDDVLMAYEQDTRQSKGSQLAQFCKWMGRKDVLDVLPKFKRRRRLPTRTLPPEADLAVVPKAAQLPRDRAIVMVLRDGGVREGEVASLKLKHVRMDDRGAILFVDGKTGERRVRLTEAVPDLLKWLEVHPKRNNPEAPLFPSTRRRNGELTHLDPKSYWKLMDRLSKRAGIPRINPHKLRHVRATEYSPVVREPVMRSHFGWSPTSTMPSRYVHLSGADVDDAIMEAKGVEVEKRRVKDERRTCPSCKEVNSPVADFCGKCRLALTPQGAVLAEERPTLEQLEKLVAERVDEAIQAALLRRAQGKPPMSPAHFISIEALPRELQVDVLREMQTQDDALA
jgi:integrase